MLCERCGERPATVFLTNIVDGQQSKRQLCEECARILGIVPDARWSLHSADHARRGKLDLTRPPDAPSEIGVADPIRVRALAAALQVKPFKVIAVLMDLGIYVSADALIDFDSVRLVCGFYGVKPYKTA